MIVTSERCIITIGVGLKVFTTADIAVVIAYTIRNGGGIGDVEMLSALSLTWLIMDLMREQWFHSINNSLLPMK